MNTLEAIAERRSIRKFADTPISGDAIDTILTAATQAPSGKNRQPWRFVVVSSVEQRAEMARIMREGSAEAEARGDNPGSSESSATIMERASVTVFVFNADGQHPWESRSTEQVFWDIVNIQSIGAAIQNMLLAAQELGIGSLWICDVFYAYQPLCDWLGEDGQMIAAVSFGHADEQPRARARRPLSKISRWI